jgi:uncharacterized membrane protein YphA (DoxX/SURF4 family)
MPEIDPVVGWAAAGAAAAVFLASGVLKFYDLESFRSAVANYRILPQWLATPFAWSVPAIESGAAAGLLIGTLRPWPALALLGLLSAFTLAIVINLARGRTDIDCGCFGPALRQQLSWWLLMRNGSLFALLAVALMPPGGRTLNPFDDVTVGFAAATVVVLYAAANFLIANAPGLRALRAVNG